MPLSDTILVLAFLLTAAMVAATVCRRLPIPFTVFLVMLGMALSALADQVPALAVLREFRLTPDLVFYVFLPGLIFESALNLDTRQMLKDILPILMLAIPALVVSTLLIGLGTWWMLGVSLTVGLLFGALISATDPVAVVGLFKELGAPLRLTTLVEGESLLNDATAIVAFHILLGIALAADLGSVHIADAVVEFIWVFAGGVVVGGAVGIGVSEFMRRIRASGLAILVMSLVMAYASFVLAEHVLHVSGVMAAVGAASAMSLYSVSRIPQAATHSIRETWEVIALIFNSLLFLMMGLSVNPIALLANLDMILVAVVLVLAARAAGVYTLVPLTTRLFAVPPIAAGERHIMWWGGLKGGLAIAIVLSIPEELVERQVLIEMTLGVVMFTLLVNASTIRPLMKFMGIDRLTDEDRAHLKRGVVDARRQAQQVLDRLEAADLLEAERSSEIARSVAQTLPEQSAEYFQENRLRQAYLEALRIETETLTELYEIGLIDEYTFLDLRATVSSDREAWLAAPAARSEFPQADYANPFARAERALLARARERNWLAGLVARYQGLRMSQRLQRDIAGILAATTVVAKLAARSDLPQAEVGRICELYRGRIAHKRLRLVTIRDDFPEFYRRFEQRFYAKAALQSALERARIEHVHGDIGAKAFTRIAREIDRAVKRIPPLLNPAEPIRAAELIERVPLFKDLPRHCLTRLARYARQVTFLPGDVIIEENARGNTLYIINQGTVDVFKKSDSGDTAWVAELQAGDFFGEMALLGDDVRTATVKAKTPVALVRLTRRTVLYLAENDPEIEHRLRAASERRSDE